MTPRVYKIACGYGEGSPIFHLRSITVAEETRYTSRFTELSDNESDERKAEFDYAIYVDALSSWSVKAPTVMKDGKEIDLIEGAKNPADAVRKLFEERTADNERIPQFVVGNYRSKLQPTIVFY